MALQPLFAAESIQLPIVQTHVDGSSSAAATSRKINQTRARGGAGRTVPLMIDYAAGNLLGCVLGLNVRFHGFSRSLKLQIQDYLKTFYLIFMLF